MDLNVEDVSPGTVAVEVRVDEERFGAAMTQVLDQLTRTVQVPGFRKGKAPRHLVERTLDATAIRTRAIERVLPGAYQEALEETGLQPLSDPEIQILSTDEDKDFRFKLIVHKRPEVTVANPDEFQLVRYVTTVDEEDMEREIANNLDAAATYETVEDAIAEKGDRVQMDVEISRDGQVLEGYGIDSLELVVGAYDHIPSIDDDLVGVKAGETRAIEVVYPVAFRDPELAGAEATWNVTVKAVQRKQIPELNEEFLEANAPGKSLEEYRQSVREGLQKRAADLDRYALQQQALQTLIEKSSAVFPHILVDQETNARLERLQRQVQRSNRKIEDFAASQQMTVDQLIDQIHAQAHVDLEEYLIIQQYAQRDSITVAPEDIDARIEEEGRNRGARPAIIELEKKSEPRRTTVLNDLVRDRVVQNVISRAQVRDQRQTYSDAREDQRSGSAPEDGAGAAAPESPTPAVSAPGGSETTGSETTEQ